MKRKIKKNEEFTLIPKEKVFFDKGKRKKNFSKSKLIHFLIIIFIIILIQLFLNFIFFHKAKEAKRNNIEYSKPIKNNLINGDNIKDNIKEKLEEIDVNILNSIQDRLGNVIEIKPDEQKFLHGLLRKYKPKKINYI